MQRSIHAVVVIGLVLLGTTVVPAQLSGNIEKVWVEQDVKVKGEKGIRVHARYAVKNGRNVYCSLQAYIERADGLSMTPGAGVFATKYDLSIYVLSEFKPSFNSSTYPDAKLFFPYSSLGLRESNPNKVKVTVQLVGEGKVYAKSSIDIQHSLGRGLF
jgi:hypothetical protein